MKQQITIKQLNELSYKGKEKLKDYFAKDNKHAPIFTADYRTGVQWNKSLGGGLVEIYYLPYMSIGQMIEFLDEVDSCNEFSLVNNGGSFTSSKKEWTVYNCSDDSKANELCDALWKEVKKVLEK